MTQNKDLRSQTPFMSENHPLNPYGSNYIEHGYESKLFYKFNLVKKYVHLQEKDITRISNYSNYFFLGVVGALILPIASIKLINRFIFKNYFPQTYDHFQSYGHFYMAISSGLGVTYSYDYFTTLYIQDVAQPLLMKYLDEAVKNGFEDYEISIK